MKNNIITFLFLFIIMAVHCTSYNEYHQNYMKVEKFPSEEKWVFNRLTSLEIPGFIYDLRIVNDKYIIVSTSIDNKLFMIYDLDSGKLLKYFGKKGQGPGEYIKTSAITTDNDNTNNFWTIAINNSRLYKYDIEKILLKNCYIPDDIITFKGVFQDQFCKIKNNFVFLGYKNDRLSFLDLSGELIKTNNYFPGNFHFHYLGYISSNPKTSEVVVANRYGDLLELYNKYGEVKKTIHGPDFLRPEKQNKKIKKHRSQDAYEDLSVTQDHIYGLYRGNKNCPANNIYERRSNKILIFDWDGNPIKRVEFNNRIQHIDISTERNKIYGLMWDINGNYHIVYHEL